MPANAIQLAYDANYQKLVSLEKYVRSSVTNFCTQHDYLFKGRIKSVDSLSEKIEAGYIKSWSEINDLYACTIVIPTRADEDKVSRWLRSAFNELSVKSRESQLKSPDVFRFDGLRWTGSLNSDIVHSDTNLPAGLDEVKFEVQVVTAFEHAWGVVTHDLVYKAGVVSWREQRLASQLKASVEQIEVLIDAFGQASAAVLESPWPEYTVKRSISDEFARMYADGLIPDNIVPNSWKRFSDNVYSLIRSYTRGRGSIEEKNKQFQEDLDRIVARARDNLATGRGVQIASSGTLFQYVLALVYELHGEKAFENFVVVPSTELATIYGMPKFPAEFIFDQS